MMLYKLLSRTDGRRIRPHVISLTKLGPVATRIMDLGIPVQALGMDLSPRDVPRFLDLLRCVGGQNFSIIHTWMYHSNIVGGLAGRVVRTPVVWGIRAAGSDFDGYRHDTILAVRAGAALSQWVPEKIVFNATSGYEAHAKLGYSRRKAVVIPNGFDTDQFAPNLAMRQRVRSELGLGQDDTAIGLVARFHPQKRQADFIEAAGKLRQQHSDVRFVLCGGGMTWQNAKLSGWIEAAGIRKCCYLLGERSDIPQITAMLDIATCCSSSEAFSNTIGEAMSCGVPCVVTDVGDSANIVGTTGVVVPPKRPDLLADAWNHLIGLGPEARADIGSRARRRIVENFSLPFVAEKYAALYDEVLEVGER